MTTLSSSTMKASAEYSTSSASSIRVRRGSTLGSPYVFWSQGDLVLHQGPASVLVLQQRADLPGPLPLVAELVLDDEDLEPRQPIQLELEDGVGLLGVQLEALDDLVGGVGFAVRLADDADDLVERVEDLLEALEEVDALRSCASSCSSRAVTTSRRKWRKCQSICFRSSRSGRPTSAFSVGTRQVRFIAKVVCSEVCLKRYAITRFSSALGFSSSSIRTSSVERSLTSTRCGILRLRTTSPICSTSCALFTP